MSPSSSSRDDALLARLAAGDEAAWDAIDRRHRPALRRWAASLSRPGVVDPDDVVQDVLVRAHRELAGGFVPDHLSAWLHRMVRNAAIDAVRARARRVADPLDDALVADTGGGPDVVIVRRERLRRVIDDVARLPDAQRRALVAVAVDDRPVEEVADELGISAPAVRMTVRRARENLVRTEEARDATCDRIREVLHDAHDRGRRPSEQARLHLQHCSDCRAYRKAFRRVDRRLRVLVPPIVPLAGLLGGGGVTVGVVGKSVVAGVLAVAVAGGGVLVERQHQKGPGDPSPVTLQAGIVSDREVRRGGALPPGTYAVTARVRLPAGVPARGQQRAVTLRCPPGTRTKQIIYPASPKSFDVATDIDSRLGIGGPTLRLIFDDRRLPRARTTRVGALCRRPDGAGSLVQHPRRARPGEVPMTTGTGFTYLRRRPGGVMRATLSAYEPVSVIRTSRRGGWVYVAADLPGVRGWVRLSQLRPAGP
ncbi:sigma-70 family RNA polymerase sigma factor [Patulibacter minatonensis]|uniref:sigma-70 family RNA polymerase sigma factor n=1 Tax=Patulibacter minatonensis TaxID=298163 RepID=UPI0004793214|nr:sigma-70 family RNA polymerase sigma factor [Patulibacter minatonensis]